MRASVSAAAATKATSAAIAHAAAAVVLDIDPSTEGGGSVFGGLLHGGDLPVERGLIEAPGLAYKRGFGRHDVSGLSA